MLQYGNNVFRGGGPATAWADPLNGLAVVFSSYVIDASEQRGYIIAITNGARNGDNRPRP
jgi:hypothetical protein